MKFLNYAGLGAVVVLWNGILLAMNVAELSFFSRLPLSSLGVDERSDAIFSLTLITASLLLVLFCAYLNRTFKVSRGFTFVFISSQLAQIVAAIAPYGGESKNIHTVAAFVLAFSLPVHMWLFASTQTGPFRNLAYKLFWLELMCFVIGIGVFVSTNLVAPIAQALPAVAFHFWIIALSVYKPSADR